MIRQPVAWLAERYEWLTDPMDAIDASQAVDPEKEAHVALLIALHHVYDAKVFTSKDVMKTYKSYERDRDIDLDYGADPRGGHACRDLGECLEDLAPGKISSRTIERILSFREGRIVGGRRLKPLPHTREKRWEVVLAE
ncbi:hypothetical protein KO116_03030 [Halomonas sp. KO116]|nr:hypothetical protein KO116_03030 [Halomonas sp. KO116]